MALKQPDELAQERNRLRAAIFEAAQRQRDAGDGDTVEDRQPQLSLPQERLAIAMQATYWAVTSNPVYVFKAYSMCRKHDIPLPWWITDYLDGAAEQINSIPPGAWALGENAAGRVYQALQFPRSGPRDPFSRERDFERRVNAAIEVDKLRHRKGMPRGEGGVTGAINEIAERLEVGSSTVRGWYYELKPVLDRCLSDNIFNTDPPK